MPAPEAHQLEPQPRRIALYDTLYMPRFLRPHQNIAHFNLSSPYIGNETLSQRVVPQVPLGFVIGGPRRLTQFTRLEAMRWYSRQLQQAGKQCLLPCIEAVDLHVCPVKQATRLQVSVLFFLRATIGQAAQKHARLRYMKTVVMLWLHKVQIIGAEHLFLVLLLQ